MNDDRISEVYKGEIWTDALQSRARRRVHWMCSQATGDSVIDIGCSQGIASILLGREGYAVAGVDIQPSRIDYAREELTKESSDTQSLVEFQVANASRLPFDDAAFDSALLGEVIEHLATPARVLHEVKRVVKPGGRIAITTPFGLSPHHDHKQTFYPKNLLETLSAVMVVETIEVVDRYFRVVCLADDPPASHRDDIAAATIDKLDTIWGEVDAQLLETRNRVAALEKEATLASKQHDETLMRNAAAAKASMDEVRARHETAIGELNHKLERSQSTIRDLEQQFAEETRSREKALSASAVLEAQVAAAKDAANKRAERDWGTFRRMEQNAAMREYQLQRRIDKLERERWKLGNGLATERWRLASLRERKWWRIGGAIGTVKRNPLRILVLPFDLVSLLFSKSKMPKRPKPPPEPKPRAVQPTPPERDNAKAAGGPEQGVDSTVPRLRPLIVSAPASMSLAPPTAPLQRNVRIAAILDTMSHDCFAPECDLVAPTPNDWLETLEAQQPHLLLVESAWRGNSGSWEYKVGTYSYAESVGLPDLTALIAWCRARSIPTVFWNKEDPVHFEKFKEAAQLFDVIFTTDANMVARYQDLPGNSSRVVDVLPFAAQLALHNPTDSLQSRDPRPVFAGAFYRARHPERREQLEQLLDGAMNHKLLIYDRMGGQITESFGFPERFRSSVVGTVSYEEMADVYRRHAVFLNANSVVDSPTMFSRRVFELLASGTPVVSTPSVGVERMFGGVVKTVTGQDEADAAIGDLLSDEAEWRRRSTAGIDLVFSNHTYSHRLVRILEVAGVDFQPGRPTVSLVTSGETQPWPSDESSDLAEVLLTGANGETASHWPVAVQAVDPSVVDDGPSFASMAVGNWIAPPHTPVDSSTVGRLLVGARGTAADLIGFASTWDEAHTYGAVLPDGPHLVARDYLHRHGWPRGSQPRSARIYLVAPLDG